MLFIQKIYNKYLRLSNEYIPGSLYDLAYLYTNSLHIVRHITNNKNIRIIIYVVSKQDINVLKYLIYKRKLRFVSMRHFLHGYVYRNNIYKLKHLRPFIFTADPSYIVQLGL